MKMKKMITAAIIGAMALSVVGCGKKGEQKSEADGETFSLMALSANGDNPTLDYALKKVKEKYPNVKFEFEDFPQDGGQAIKTRAATGDLPDIIWLNSGLIEPLSKSDSILAIDDYIKDMNYADKLNKPAQENCMLSSDGHNYVFPVDGVAPIIWYYNRALFEDNSIKIPENYPELLDAVKKLKEKEIIPMALFGKEPWPLGAFFDAFTIKGNPSGAYGLSENEAQASDKEYASAIDKMSKLVDAGMLQSGVTNADYDTAFALFASGKAAMFQNGVWNVPEITEALGEDAGYFVTYPTGDENATQNNKAFTGGGDTVGFGLSKNVKNKDLAAEIAALLSESYAEYNYAELGNVSSAIDFEKTELIKPLPAMSQDLVKEIPNMTFDSMMLQNFPNSKFATGFAEEMQNFLVGESADNFKSNLDALINKTNK